MSNMSTARSTSTFEETSSLEDLWLQHERQHKGLLEMGMVHVTGTKRFPKPLPELSGTYEEHNNGLVVVVSARGLIFVGRPQKLTFLIKEGMKKISVGTITSPTRESISLLDLFQRRRDPLCIRLL